MRRGSVVTLAGLQSHRRRGPHGINSVTAALIENIDRELRSQINGRHQSMLREMRFLKEREDSSLLAAMELGWTERRLEVLCGLNAFTNWCWGPWRAQRATARAY